ncbi:MAG: uroporphyrinogen-III synthase [Xanthomonadaceae bacterium]|jgi:uroporphyrinogen-III synthase|nr:uroporphyrinogen-III synthase [Xanthomonadaceae bacterium]
MSSVNAAWCLISLRPAGEHAPIRRAAARVGVPVLALSPWRLRLHDDPETRARLDEALNAPCVLFTSPAAVKAMLALAPVLPDSPRHGLAVGAGTAAAMRRAGIALTRSPERMDSEGLLTMPELRRAMAVGLVTAPGGRGVIVSELARRGVPVIRADIYERIPIAFSAAALAKLRSWAGRTCIALSSGEALRLLMRQLADEDAALLRQGAAAAASDRLADMAREHGFTRIVRAIGPRPGQLIAAARQIMATHEHGFR